MSSGLLFTHDTTRDVLMVALPTNPRELPLETQNTWSWPGGVYSRSPRRD